MSQTKLADKLGVSRATVSGWCSGKRTPTRDNTVQIAEVLGTTPMYLEYGQFSPDGDRAANAELVDDRAGYLADSGWYFRPAPKDGGRELGNAAAFAFRPSIETLAREAGQNSSDEILPAETTVRMRFTVLELTDDHLERFLEALRFHVIEPHLEAAAVSGQKAGAVIDSGLRQLRQEGRLVLIRIEDYNASGLTGAEFDRGRFLAVARNILDSFKGDQAGGSFGLGKAAMWACSQFGLVLLNSTLSEPDNGRREGRFIGRMEIPWHETEEGSFAGPAWLGQLNDDEVAESYWGNRALLNDLYLARTDAAPGTSFLIVAAFDPSGEATTADEMHDALAEAMATNFWAAMVESEEDHPERLRVAVVTERNGVRIREDIVDPSRYDHVRGRVEMLNRYRLDLTSDDLESEDTVVVRTVSLQVPKRIVPPGEHEAITHDAVLLIAAADEGDADAKRVSYMRGSLMTIMDQRVSGLPLGAVPFRAVVLGGNAAGNGPGERAAERFLRAAENPEHDKWEGTADLTTAYAVGARTRLREFFNDVRSTIKEVVTRPSTDVSDGPEALKELLRIAPPKAETDPRPRVWEATGSPNGAGAWEVEAVVSLPARDEPWQFTPVLRYGTESGPTIPVKWAEIIAVAKCRLDSGRLVSDPQARKVRFKAVSDPASHPVGASRAKALMDVRVYSGDAV